MITQNNSYIIIEKASEHNLKDISVLIPHHQITCVTGVSGSGKSSLVHDIIAKESQRRYLETFSSYARQFVGKLSRPEVEKIEGLMPAITVDQKTVSRNPRSTVGTMSELYDYLRLLFARLGKSSKGIVPNRSLFSFNNPEGQCPNCKGLGVEDKIDPNLLVKDERKSLREGALNITTPSGYTIYSQVTIDVMDQVCRSEGFNVDIPWKNLTIEQKNIVLNGSNKIKIPYGKHTLESRMKWSGITAKPREEGFYKGILPVMENILRVDRNPNILRFAKTVCCSLCEGKRLNTDSLSFKINNKNIYDFAKLSIANLNEEFKRIQFKREDKLVGESIKQKINERCDILIELGLGYLSLTRESTSLSGGEAQRIRLATQVGNQLRGILYILDEPSVGLHPRDTRRMIDLMKRLRDQGNTVLVVEHDKETMLNSDRLIDIGPKAGYLGGELLFNSEVKDLEKLTEHKSETLKSIADKDIGESKNQGTAQWLSIKNASLHNLKNINVDFKLHSLNLVTGVSGAGKSSLVFGCIGNYFERGNTKNNFVDDIISDDKIHKTIEIDQSPIGRTPRSNAATYTKLFDLIRKLYAEQELAIKNKWKQGFFSFNTKGGRCEACEGSGFIQTGMHFLSNVNVVCETCNGSRYKQETLQVRYKEQSIADVLEMEISKAKDFFNDQPKIHHYLEVLNDLGLGYLTLGQPATTLSGGEAQRLKLAAELVKPTAQHTLYLFDEPTTGLHAYDIKILLQALNNLKEQGHTVIIVEHDKDIIYKADHIVDLGPEGGDEGGKVVFTGTYNNLLRDNTSITAKALRNEFEQKEKKTEKDIQEVIDAPIKLNGVTTHNLKNIDVDFPRNKLTVITGVSGSGKSSLAFDTLFAEGQYRYIENFSTYTRSLIQQKARPQIEEASGITPSIAIDNKSATKSPRATVGTISGIYDLYRLLFSRISKDLNGKTCTEPTSLFSFNHQKGSCPVCNGLGFELTCDENRLISNPSLSIKAGAMNGSKTGKFYSDPFGQYMAILDEVGKTQMMDFDKPWNELSEKEKSVALKGTGDEEYNVIWKFKRKNREGIHEFKSKWPGLFFYINDEFLRKHDKQGGTDVAALMKEVNCTACHGSRLNNNALLFIIAGKNIHELVCMQADESIEYIESLEKELSDKELKISKEIRRLIVEKLQSLKEIGLGYLTISRKSASLSGGEGRRLRLVSQLGGELIGITYVLDEPTVGLHSKDTKSLIRLLKKLSENNTVVVVEHDEEIIKSADYIIELGPGAGVDGGEIIKASSFNAFSVGNSLTASYLNKTQKFNLKRLDGLHNKMQIENAKANNLKGFSVDLLTNGITVFSGVSGSGKSSLVFDVIGESVKQKKAINCKKITGFENFDSVVYMDQSAIGRSSLSTPLTFLDIYEHVKSIFAKIDKAKELNLKSSYFAYNSKQGQCEHCKGTGIIKIPMDFLSDVSKPCEKCGGKRFKDEVLKVDYNGLNISEILEKTIAEAENIFAANEILRNAFNLLNRIGLGHLKLGQSATTFSGGESQRLKLAKELVKPQSNKSLYLLDEPTTGLHFSDIEKLIDVLLGLRDKGHALYIVEHHPWFYKLADCLIELGPTGGEKGGYIEIKKGT